MLPSNSDRQMNFRCCQDCHRSGQREVAVIFANGSPSAVLAAKAATPAIPIVFISPEDSRKYGLVTRLNRPEGNVTGMNFCVAELAGKRLQLLSEIVPHTTTIAYLSGPPNSVVFKNLRDDILAAARTQGRDLLIVPVSQGDYDAASHGAHYPAHTIRSRDPSD
jgi:putative ABC transport system substrate-binding protein